MSGRGRPYVVRDFQGRVLRNRYHPYRRPAAAAVSSRRLFARPSVSKRRGNAGKYRRVVKRGGRRVGRRVGRRTGRRRNRSSATSGYGMYASKPSKFQKQLAIAQGIRNNMQLTAICQFQVPLTKTHGPSAQYVWPRDPAAVGGEQSSMMYPLDNYSQTVITNKMYAENTGNGTAQYQDRFYIRYVAKYSIRNQNNFPTRFEVLKMRCKKSIVYNTDGNALISSNYNNPFNVAGNYLRKMNDVSNTDPANATNFGLHTIRTKFELLPPIKEVFSCRKKLIKLEPGEQRDFTVSHGRWFKWTDIYGVALPDNNHGTPHYEWLRGTRFICFKMFSEPADYNEDTEDPSVFKHAGTRTTPVCLLAYEVLYYTLKPQLQPFTVFNELGGVGYVADPDPVKIQNMEDDDFKTQAQINTI